MRFPVLTQFIAAVTSLFLSHSASADPVLWVKWADAGHGQITAADGSSITVQFSTANPVELIQDSPSWTPASSFADGKVVDNGPVASNGMIKLVGGTYEVNRITFSKPVVDPVISIWSLGNHDFAASFVFPSASPWLVAGGPNAEYEGASLILDNDEVNGSEGSGTLVFRGTFTSIEWLTPVFEDHYGFTIGIRE